MTGWVVHCCFGGYCSGEGGAGSGLMWISAWLVWLVWLVLVAGGVFWRIVSRGREEGEAG